MAADEPNQSYFPSARVRLLVRVEDFGNPKVPPPPFRPPHLRRGVGLTKDSTSKLTVEFVNGVWKLSGPGSTHNQLGSPQQQQASSDGLSVVGEGIIPSAAQLKLNGIRTASTLSVTIPFLALPLDPRAIRAVAIEYYLGCVSAEDYQRGIRGEVRSDNSSSGALDAGLPLHVIPDTYVDPYGHQRTNLRFQGWVDTWETTFPENDENSVQLECCDNTRQLLDQDAPMQLHIEPKVRIDQAIANYLANFPQFTGLSVQYLPMIDPSRIPTLGAAYGKTAFQPHFGPPPAGGGGTAGGGSAENKLKVWDYLTDVTKAVGHLVRMVGTTIIVQRPRTIFDSALAARTDDPFHGRNLPSGPTLQRRLYVYGHNVTELKIKRKYAKNVPKNVEVRSYDPMNKLLLVVRYPSLAQTKSEPKRLQTKPHPGDANDQAWHVQNVQGVRDKKTLSFIAQGIYEQIGRGELEIKLLTKNLGSFGGGNLDPDALDLQVGDAVDIEINRQSDGTTIPNSVSDIQKELHDHPVDYLTSIGYSKAFANAYTSAIQNASGIPTTFRCKSIGIDWDMTSAGVTLDIELMNYVEVRANQDLEAADQITNADETNAAAQNNQPVNVIVADE